MTDKEAKAILLCRKRVEAALNACEAKLGEEELQYAQSYWMSHIRDSMNGRVYGSAPVAKAEERLDP